MSASVPEQEGYMDRMKAAALLMAFFFAAGQGLAPQAFAAEEKSLEEMKQELQSSFSTLLDSLGVLLGGLAAGVQEGAQKMQEQLDGIDGTNTVSTAEQLRRHTQVSVLKAEEAGPGEWAVTLAVRNSGSAPVRLTAIHKEQNVLLVDSEGFAHEALLDYGTPESLTVAPGTASRLGFRFSGLEKARPVSLRLYGVDIFVDSEGKAISL